MLPGKGKSYMKFEYSPVVRLRDEDGSYKICEPLCTGFQWVLGRYWSREAAIMALARFRAERREKNESRKIKQAADSAAGGG